MRRIDFEEKLKSLPHEPGCYIYKNKQDEIIYVGKSKELKKRVNSYFRGAHDLKTSMLVQEIYDLEYFITATEVDALLLEMNLIKKHQPKYNIRLTDDKSYPYIQVTHERHPRLIVTRNPKERHGRVFGPYPSAFAAHETVKLLNKMYPLRNCTSLPKKECIYYHINQCLGPCITDVSVDTYKEIKADLYKFLSGDVKQTVKELTNKMQVASDELLFEQAKEYRDLIKHIETVIEKQQMFTSDIVDKDVFGSYIYEGQMAVTVFFYRAGKISMTEHDLVDIVESETDPLSNYVAQFYLNKNHPKPKEILVPFEDEILSKTIGIKVVTPKIGDKKKLVELANKNAAEQIDHLKLVKTRVDERTIGAADALAELLNKPSMRRIEAFDNSNLMGTDSVSAMVVYINGTKSKKDYRKFKVKTVKGPDDYGTMKEVIYRRYMRVLRDDLERPDLIIVDGGLGQVNVALEVLHSLRMELDVIGLKKDNNHHLKSIITATGEEIPLSVRSNVYRLLFDIQEEVHRFAISFHRNTKSKSVFDSLLDDIDGLGPKRRTKLLKHFSSMTEIKDAEVYQIAQLGIPEEVAARIIEKLKESLK